MYLDHESEASLSQEHTLKSVGHNRFINALVL